MKKVILLVSIFIVVTSSSFAQDKKDTPKTPEEKTEKIMKRLTKELILTADQQQKMKVLILDNEKEKEEMKKARKIRKEKMEADLKSILSPEQYSRLKEKENKKK